MSDDEEDDRPFPTRGSPEWEEMMAPHRAWIAQMDEDRAAERAAERAEKENAEKALTPDVIRQRSSARLLAQLDVVTDLAAHCQQVAADRNTDRIAPVLAAAKLITASAQVASALAKVTSAEQRQRRIIERIQSFAPQKPYLNCALDAAPQNNTQNPPDLSKQAAAALDGLLFDTLQRKMLLYMNMVAAETLDPELKKAYPEAYASGGTFAEPPAETSAEVGAGRGAKPGA